MGVSCICSLTELSVSLSGVCFFTVVQEVKIVFFLVIKQEEEHEHKGRTGDVHIRDIENREINERKIDEIPDIGQKEAVDQVADSACGDQVEAQPHGQKPPAAGNMQQPVSDHQQGGQGDDQEEQPGILQNSKGGAPVLDVGEFQDAGDQLDMDVRRQGAHSQLLGPLVQSDQHNSQQQARCKSSALMMLVRF